MQFIAVHQNLCCNMSAENKSNVSKCADVIEAPVYVVLVMMN